MTQKENSEIKRTSIEIRVSKGYEPLIKICTLKTEHDIGMFLNL